MDDGERLEGAGKTLVAIVVVPPGAFEADLRDHHEDMDKENNPDCGRSDDCQRFFVSFFVGPGSNVPPAAP